MRKLHLMIALSAILFLIVAFAIPEGGGATQNLPPGNYENSCKDFIVIGYLLQATCRERGGDWRRSTIFFVDCDYIVNDNGRLECGNWRNTGVPLGSYRLTCRDLDIDGNTLKARCLDRDGDLRKTSIKYKNCSGNIFNDDGRLSCNSSASTFPAGSYRITCRDLDIDGDTLKARCFDSAGDLRRTSIKYKNCSGNIFNNDGRLSCNSRAAALPEGSYVFTCRDIRIDGDYLEAECKKDTGGWRDTDINFKNCRGSIVNDNGRLECRR
ncbi:MAG: CVNH domain-containing protein [Deltaproteobacteria bacterium]